MKKRKRGARKRLLIAILVVAGAIGGFFAWSALKPAAPASYTTSTPTGGAIEARYLAEGTHSVAEKDYAVLESYKRYEVWYPADLADGERCPIVVVSNGTGVPASKAKAVWEHYASWGMVVIATEEGYSWNGFSSEMCVRFAEKLDAQETIGDEEGNALVGHLDLSHIAAIGHSQGGVGVANALSSWDHAGSYTCCVMLSPTNLDLAHSLEWDYDPTKISVPTLIMASTGQTDAGLVVSKDQLRAIYDEIASPQKFMAHRNDCDHGEMLYRADGYVTAFLLWQLEGDEEAAAAFTGTNPELAQNSLYEDVALSQG